MTDNEWGIDETRPSQLLVLRSIAPESKEVVPKPLPWEVLYFRICQFRAFSGNLKISIQSER